MSEFVSLAEIIENKSSLTPIKEEIFEMKSSIKKHMDTGLSSDEMKEAKIRQDAVMAAEAIMEKLHNSL